jgi:hypothetical protein
MNWSVVLGPGLERVIAPLHANNNAYSLAEPMGRMVR